MPTQKPWKASDFPAVLHHAMAIYLILGEYTEMSQEDDDLCICVLPDRMTIAVVLRLDGKNDLVFHVGGFEGRTRAEMEKVLEQYTERWDALSREEVEVQVCTHIPLRPWHPIVVGQLEINGYFESEDTVDSSNSDDSTEERPTLQ